MIKSPLVRFGLVGAGQIAGAYAEAFTRSRNACLVGVADIRPAAAKALADAHGCESFGNWESLVNDGCVDAVVVATPPVTHTDICCDLAAKGVHVLCEKPLAITPESARSMVEAAQRAQIKLTMASKFRCVPDVSEAKALIQSGVIGQPILLENTFAAHVDMRSRWNSDPGVSGGGVLIDNGTHSLDIVRYLLGPLAAVQAIEGQRVQELPVEDTVRLFARTVSGVMCSIDLSWSLDKETPYYVSVYGSEGTILLGWQGSKYRRVGEDWQAFGSGYNKIEAFANQISNFAGAILGNEPLRIQPAEAIASVDAVEVAYEALGRDGWISVTRLEDNVFAGS